jgi:Glycosyl transferases group 1
MKIAYIIEWGIYEHSGVLRKITGQIAEWESDGHEVIPVIITPRQNKKPLISGRHFYSRFASLVPISFLANYLNKIFTISRVQTFLDDIKSDIVYTRQNIWYPGLDTLLAQHCSIMELNSDDVKELSALGGIKAWIYFYGREKLLAAVSAFVSVSHEISKLYADFKKPMITIGNGFCFNESDHQAPKPMDWTRPPNVVFVGTPNQPWHGTDKILTMAEKLPEFQFHIAGSQNTLSAAPPNLTFHGYLDQEGLNRLYESMDIGVGTLALHRIGMSEASPLKTREYLAHHLPMVVGFVDTDLDGQEFVLNIGNYQNNVVFHIKEIRGFVLEWTSKGFRADPFFHLIDYKQKEKKRLDFFRDILTKKHD